MILKMIVDYQTVKESDRMESGDSEVENNSPMNATKEIRKPAPSSTRVNKMRRKRRGRKRRMPDNGQEWESDSDGNNECPSRVLRRKSRKCIRPFYSPNAPMNSTQFLMDDHENCHFYTSFETAGTTLGVKPDGRDSKSPYSSNFDSSDEDYSSPNDDWAAFDYLQRDFEDTYRGMREEQLFQMSKGELVKEVYNMEQRVTDLEKKLERHQQQSLLESLTDELKELKKINLHLKSQST